MTLVSGRLLCTPMNETTTDRPEPETPSIEAIQPPIEAPPAAIDPDDAAVLAALALTDPDGPTVRMRTAYRDLSCKMSGEETYRMFRYPGTTEFVWGSGPRLAARGPNAAQRRCSVSDDIPIGSIVQDFERAVYHWSRGKCKVRFAIVIEDPANAGKAKLIWLDHRTLRSLPVYKVALPNGTTIDVPRREV